MSILKSASLAGMWGEKDIELTFHRDVNFLIGANGSGKTTVINLIAAALSADYDSLSRIPFSSVTCKLQDDKSPNKETEIIVTRDAEILGPSQDFKYQIIRGTDRQQFSLISSTFRLSGLRYQRVPTIDQMKPESLAEIVRVNWLSVHRSPSKLKAADAPATDSSVDRRLTQLGNQLVRFFSKLAGRREYETSRFLKQLFPILFSASSATDALSEAQKVDLPKLKESINEVIQQVGLASKALDKNVTAHFSLAELAKSKQAYSSAELAALLTCIPLQRVVEAWNKTQDRQEEIDKPRRDFLAVMNAMFDSKQLIINARNELEVLLPSEKHLALSDLSSGEKQLLIIMAEALLQEDSEFIYIADEPELSLHVRWQEQLTRNLRKINQKAQVIFATHSPDIVSEFGNRVIDMERVG